MRTARIATAGAARASPCFKVVAWHNNAMLTELAAVPDFTLQRHSRQPGDCERSVLKVDDSVFQTFVEALEACLDRRRVLGKEGVIYPPEYTSRYAATPLNGVTFATMGVDGVHYVVLQINGQVTDNSPVIQVAPMDFRSPYSVLGDSFLEYLALCCGVSSTEMNAVVQNQRQGKPVLVPFLSAHFDQSRIRRSTLDRSIDRYRSLMTIKK